MALLLIYSVLSIILAIHWSAHKDQYRGRLMIAPFIPLIVAAGSAIYQGIKGAKQKREARRLQAESDQMDAANLNEARRMALSGLPEAEYRKALQNIYRNQSTALSSLKDRRMALAGATTVQQATNDALLNLAAADARARQQNQYNALNMANRSAAMRGERGMYERASGEALTGAAMQNVFNAAGYAATSLGGEASAGGGLFGTNSEGAANRGILGTTPIYGGSAMGRVSSGLSKPLPKLNYAKPY